jgi:hypothetical protein
MTTPEPTTWTVHLAKQRPVMAVVILLVIFFGLFAAYAIGKNWVFVALAALLLLSSVAEFLFPVSYRLDAQGASSRHFGSWRVLPWAQVRRVYLSPNGIKLSPLPARGWAEAYRGVTLRMTDRDTVLAQVQGWLDAAGVTPQIIED